MAADPTEPAASDVARKLIIIVLGLAALVTAMLAAFALPSVNGGPHHVPIGVTGPPQATGALQTKLDGDAWDVTAYDSADAITSAVKDREIMGGLVVGAGGVEVYTATAAGPSVAGALTALGNTMAAQQHTQATVHDLVPFSTDDPRGAGLGAATLPLIFGGVLPAVILSRVFPGHRGLRTRVGGVLLFALAAGFAVTAFLHYITGSLDGAYLLTSLGLSLGIAALSTTFIGLEALTGFAGIGVGAGVMMLLGNPLSGLATGPHWLPGPWAGLGQVLPPGASGGLLRANAFFDGAGAAGPSLILGGWVLIGLALAVIADRRGREPDRSEQANASPLSVEGAV